MRPFIIVTVKDTRDQWNYDVELPTNVPLAQLAEDLAEALALYTHGQSAARGGACSLYCQRKQQTLSSGETLGEQGIWTGDVLILLED